MPATVDGLQSRQGLRVSSHMDLIESRPTSLCMLEKGIANMLTGWNASHPSACCAFFGYSKTHKNNGIRFASEMSMGLLPMRL